MSSSSSQRPVPIQTLPIVTIQSTFTTVINEVYNGVIPYEDIWISCYHHSQSNSRSSHAKVSIALDEEDRERVVFDTKDGGDLKMALLEEGTPTDTYTVSLPSLSIPPTRLLTPFQEYTDPERSTPRLPHRITAFAVAPDKSQLTTGFLDGSVYLYAVHPLPSQASISMKKYTTAGTYAPPRATYTTHRQTLVSGATSTSTATTSMSTKAHKSTVTSLRFFPSSRVILSSSADFSLQIYPADPLSPSSSTLPPENQSTRIPSVRTLLPLPSSSSPHTRPSPISATAILGRGRTILSASNSSDGAIRTWDVSKGIEVEESVARTGGGGGGVNKVVFVEDGDRAEAVSHGAVNGTGAGAGGEGQGASGTIPAGDGDGGQAQAQEVKGKLFCTLQDGSFEVFQISSFPSSSSRPKSLFKSTRSPHGALTAIAVSPIQAISPSSSSFKKFRLLATGTSGGVITVYAIAIPPSSSSSISPSSHVQPEIEAEAEALSQSLSLSTPLIKFRRSDAGIEDLAFTSLPSSSDGVQGLGLVVATTDGLPWIAKLKLSPLSLTSPSGSFSAGTKIEEVKVEIGVEVGVYAELTGGDVDPVRGVAVVGHSRLGEGELEGDGTEVWTAGDDGVVRRYLL